MKKLIGFILIVLLSCSVMAQSENVPLPRSLQTKSTGDGQEKPERKVKFVAGGTVGFGFSRSELNLQLSPHFGIKPAVDFLCFGVGGTYNLNYYKDPSSGLKYFTHIFGFNAFAEGYIWNRLVLHAEYEWLNFPGGEDRWSSNGVLVGPGYTQGLTDKVSMYGLILFPVYDERNVYGVVEMRVGVNVTF